MMGILLELILAAYIVYPGLIFAQTYNQIGDQTIISNTNDGSKFQEDNDPNKSKISIKTLKHEMSRKQQVFDTMKEQLQIAQNINILKKINFFQISKTNGHIMASKRETNKQDTDMLNVSETRELFEAARKNDVLKVKSIVEEHNVPISVTNDLRQSLAHAAAAKGSLDVVKYVAQKMPSILAKTDKHDFTVLRLAVKAGAFNIVQYLVENHEDDLTKRSDRDFRSTSVHTAIEYGHLEILKYLLDVRNFDVNVLGEWMDQPPIFSAVQYGQKHIVKYLVDEKNVDLELLDSRKENILYVTVRVDDLPYMKHLLEEKGIPFDLNGKNLYGETLVYRAASLNRTSILEYLVDERLADVNIANNWEQLTPLHCAAILGNYKICKYLIEHEAKADAKDKMGQIPADKTNNRELKNYLKSASILNVKRSSTRYISASASPSAI